MTDEKINEIEERTNRATPGPWEHEFINVIAPIGRPNGEIIGAFLPSIRTLLSIKQNVQNTEFTAHAREDIPALLAEVRRLRNSTGDRRPMPK